MPAPGADLGESLQGRAIGDRDERPSLEVLGRAGPTTGVEDGRDDIVGEGSLLEGADDARWPMASSVSMSPSLGQDAIVDGDEPSNAAGPYPGIIEVVVEIPRGSRNKYEFDPRPASSAWNAVLHRRCRHLPRRLRARDAAGDGDPTDTLLLIDEPNLTGRHVWARPVGAPR